MQATTAPTARGTPSPELNPSFKERPYRDIEQQAAAQDLLRNTTVRHISWSGVTVTVKDRDTKQLKVIVDNVQGSVEAGELLALMGPSGCGKTTLLNMLASRATGAAHVDGKVLVNGITPSKTVTRQISCFVEQEDALIGALTVRETLHFAAELAGLNSQLSKSARTARVDDMIDAFGLRAQANAIIGTPIRKGISGGQKRRVGIASQLITGPKVLFLDEPTSGLDSAASFEVTNYLKSVARRNNLIIVASIHQPSTPTFNLFDKLLLLSGGKTHYFGPVQTVVPYYEAIGHPIPVHVNPAEFLLEQVNADFTSEREHVLQRLDKMQEAWVSSSMAQQLSSTVAECETSGQPDDHVIEGTVVSGRKPSFASLVLTLLHRSFVKSYRDVIAYGVRGAMYSILALLVGTVWLRLDTRQEYIQPYINAIFFGGAFMSFMAVAYVPAFLEDRAQYIKEHHNGLYNADALVLSNFVLGVPYLFAIVLGFSCVSYWLSSFNPTPTAFFTWVLWLFLDLLVSESFVVLVAALTSHFVVALAMVALANGLWMAANGFMVQLSMLNVFYKYVFSYWDYQRYVFEGMMVNEFAGRVYECAQGCQCMYQTELAQQCLISGEGVLMQYGYETGHLGKNVGIMLGILAGFRVAAWLALMLRK